MTHPAQLNAWTSPDAKAGTTLDGASYTVDNAGNRSSRTPLPGTTATNYTYDAIYGLLTAKQGATTTESYTYDPVGNRLTSLGISSYTTNSSNQLTAKTGTTYTYNNNGNLLTKVDSTGTTSYTWDFENRLTSVTLPGSGGTVSFKYDPYGRRIYKSSSSGSSVYAYDGDDLIEETNSTGAVVARYSQTENIDEPLAMLRSATTSYFHADGLGSVTSLSNAAGSISNTYTYDSFGKLTASTGSLANPFQYTARESDTETMLDYMRARYFDPSTGRFVSEDPIHFKAGVNFYRYVRNNPVNLKDPFGLAPPGTGAVVGGLIGGTIGGILGAGGGATVGTLAFPGGGTITLGIAGGIKGAGEGAVIGAALGAALGNLIDSIRKQCNKKGIYCTLSGPPISVPGVDDKLKLCPYTCSDGSFRILTAPVGVPCLPDFSMTE